MKKRTRSLVALTGLLILFVLGNQAFATENAIDVVPAATLLLPYFEVDLANNGGVTTLFSVNNASAAPQLAHVTFWTDQSRPTLDFTIWLTGYDVWTVNLGPLFRAGVIPLFLNPININGLPATGGPRQAPANDDEDAGDFSFDGPGDPAIVQNTVAAGEGPACTFPLPNLPPSFLSFIQRVHTGQSVPAGFSEVGKCGAAKHGINNSPDTIARGYMTIDVVRDCAGVLTPAAGPAYFSGIAAGGTQDEFPPGTANVLWGDFFLVNPTNNFAQGDTLVHIESYRDRETFFDGNGYTFYGRYVNFNGSDNREPLATTWGSRYSIPGALPSAFDSTNLLCWRDTGAIESRNYYTCAAAGLQNVPVGAAAADGQPLSQNDLVIFDEEENPIQVESSPFSPPPEGDDLVPCPWESTKVAVGGETLPVSPFQFGWIYINLNTTNDASEFPPPTLQSWLGTLFQASGKFSVGLQGVHFDLANDPTDICLGQGGQTSDCTVL
jgi:hypothetical protein